MVRSSWPKVAPPKAIESSINNNLVKNKLLTFKYAQAKVVMSKTN